MPEPPPQADTLEKVFLKEPVKTSTTLQKNQVLLAKPNGPAVGGAEWDFGWKDLQRVSGKLTISETTPGVPHVIEQNLINTIKYVLDPGNAIDGVLLSRGVNVRDLYHAHIVYPKSPNQDLAGGDCKGMIPAQVEETVKSFQNTQRDALANTKAPEGPYLAQDGRIQQPTAAERELIRRANSQLVESFKVALGLIAAKLPQGAMIYHTYEWDSRIPREAKQRNIFTAFSDNIPRAGDYYNAYDSPNSRYCQLLQVAFLVNPRGEIFLFGGNDQSLAGLEYR